MVDFPTLFVFRLIFLALIINQFPPIRIFQELDLSNR
jgi:hypothetical protein